MQFYKKLYWQVFIGLGLGILFGHLSPEWGAQLKPWADAFIKLIKMMISPIIFCTIVTGMSGMSDMKKMGKIGALSLFYFEVTSTLALLLGWLAISVFPVGNGMNISLSQLDTSQVSQFTHVASTNTSSAISFINDIIPHTFVSAMTEGQPLQILLVSVLFGLALQACGGQKNPVYHVIDSVTEVFFKMVGTLMKLAPLGTFCAISYTVGKFGLGTLVPLVKFVALYWITCAVFLCGVIGVMLYRYKISVFKLIAYLKDEILVTLGTCTSEAVLPQLLKKLEQLGVKKDVTGLVLPAGMAFNLDGTYMYFTMAAIFLAQATGTYFPLSAQLSLFLLLLITSKGANAVYGSAFIILGSTLSALGTIPVESMALVLGIDRFIAMARAVTNMAANCCATILIAKYTNDVDDRVKQLEF